MNRVLIALTARQLLGRRRTFVMALVLALPVTIAIIYRTSAEYGTESVEKFALDLCGALILTLLLPLVSLVLGTASLGAEIEDGTAVFLLTKPIERWRLIAVKIGVAAVGAASLVVPVTFATAWIVVGSPTEDGVAIGLGVAAAVASTLYCAVFVALSAVTSRALVFGLAYVFVWEGIVTNAFESLAWVSVRSYSAGWADLVISISDTEIFDPPLPVGGAVIASTIVFAAAVAYGTHALTRFEIGERA